MPFTINIQRNLCHGVQVGSNQFRAIIGAAADGTRNQDKTTFHLSDLLNM
ncbi:hypothetical protein AB28_0669 [Raoultella ornithinolytica 2-156-04_S1_C2]|nr:hypothetical protein AB28_0669 [Raoultella ornithinolytica 2-156-04_S1_C2]